MDIIANNLTLQTVALAQAFSTSVTFAVLKLLMEIYVIVMIVDIAFMLKQRGIGADLRDTWVGANIPEEFGNKKNRLRARWTKIQKRMKSGNESEYKVAIIEADQIVDGLIAKMNYKGENMTERLDNITPGQIENIENLRWAHDMRNRIIHDESYVLTEEEAEKIFDCYEDFLRFFMVLE